MDGFANFSSKKLTWISMLIFCEKINMEGHADFYMKKINMDGHANFFSKN